MWLEETIDVRVIGAWGYVFAFICFVYHRTMNSQENWAKVALLLFKKREEKPTDFMSPVKR